MTMDNLSKLLILFTIISHVASEFACTHDGRLPNPSDPEHRTYYYCKQLRNGTFIKQLYKCPGTTLFNPSAELCSEDYKPQRPTTTPSEEIFECSQRGRFPDSTDETCRRYYLCSTLHNETYVKALYICPNNTYFDPRLGICSGDYHCSQIPTNAPESSTLEPSTEPLISSSEASKSSTETPEPSTTEAAEPDEFVCEKKGRFKDPADYTCTVYYLCSQLKNGDFLKTKYKCPSGSYFDPESHRCTFGYVCNSTTSKGEVTAVTQSSDSDRNTIPVSSITNGEQTYSTTSRSTLFDPDEITTFSDNGDITTNEGFSSSETSLDDLKSTTNKGIPLSSTVSKSTAGDIVSTLHEDSSSSTTLDSTNSDVTNPEDAFTCTEKGRFADPRDSICKNYFLCSKLHNGTLIKTKYQCPTNSRFDPDSHVCSTSYTCPGPTRKPCRRPRLSKPPAFPCVQKGRYRDPDDNTCQLYFLCSQLLNGTFIATKYRCPEGSYFDPELGRCSTMHVCSGVATTPAEVEDCEDSGDDDYTEEAWESTTVFTDGDEDGQSGGVGGTTESDTSGGGGDVFVCAEKGRFPDLNDTSCENYFLCSKLHNGSFLQTQFKCPEGTLFDPNLHTCSASYKCHKPTTVVDDLSSYTTTDNVSPSNTESSSNTTSETTTSSTTAEIVSTTPSKDASTSVTWESNGNTVGYTKTTNSNSDLISTIPDADYSSYDSSASISDDDSNSKTSAGLYTPTSAKDTSTWESDGDGGYSKTANTILSSDLTENSFAPTNSVPDYSNFHSTASISDESNSETSAEFFTPTFKGISTSTTLESDVSEDASETSAEFFTPTSTKGVSTTLESNVSNGGFTKTTLPESYSSTDDYSEEVFTCSSKGRFADPTDTTCTAYYLCAQWRNGTFSSWKFKCPDGSFFSPITQTCSTNYQCPHLTGSTEYDFDSTSWGSSEEYDYNYTDEDEDYPSYFTTGESEMTYSDEDFSILTTRFGHSKPANDIIKTTESIITEGTFNTISSSGTTKSTDNSSIANATDKTTDDSSMAHASDKTTEDFLSITEGSINTPVFPITCSKKGRYPDPNDLTCTIYYLCSKLRNGTFFATKFKCPRRTYFNPSMQTCSSEYQCLTVSTTPEELVGSSIGESSSLLTTRLGFVETSTTSKETANSDKTENDSLPTTLFEQTSTATDNDLKKTDDSSSVFEASTEVDGSSHSNPHSSISDVRTTTNSGNPSEKTPLTGDHTHPEDFSSSKTETSLPTKITAETENTKHTEVTFPCEDKTVNNENTEETIPSEEKTENSERTEVTIPFEDETVNDKLTEVTNIQDLSTLVSVTNYNTDGFDETTTITSINQTPTQEVINYTNTNDFNGNSTTEFPKTTNTDIMHGHTIGTYYFCKARGYYKNFNDPTGVSYFYCDIASDGRLFQYLLTCPADYYYNDDNHLCSPVRRNLL